MITKDYILKCSRFLLVLVGISYLANSYGRTAYEQKDYYFLFGNLKRGEAALDFALFYPIAKSISSAGVNVIFVLNATDSHVREAAQNRNTIEITWDSHANLMGDIFGADNKVLGRDVFFQNYGPKLRHINLGSCFGPFVNWAYETSDISSMEYVSTGTMKTTDLLTFLKSDEYRIQFKKSYNLELQPPLEMPINDENFVFKNTHPPRRILPIYDFEHRIKNASQIGVNYYNLKKVLYPRKDLLITFDSSIDDDRKLFQLYQNLFPIIRRAVALGFRPKIAFNNRSPMLSPTELVRSSEVDLAFVIRANSVEPTSNPVQLAFNDKFLGRAYYINPNKIDDVGVLDEIFLNQSLKK